tara:strand:- start:39 stop:179 length:141 start_codon:yes stop_codon:yes gene_type:complete
MSRLDKRIEALLKIEMVTKASNINEFTAQEIINEINFIIDKAYEQE